LSVMRVLMLVSTPVHEREKTFVAYFHIQQLVHFRFFRDYIPNFASVAKPLTDLTSKRISNRIPFGQRERVEHFVC